MSDIQRGITFLGVIPDAASAHQLVDAAVILPSFISGKTTATPATVDSFVFLKNGALRQCTLAGLIGAFPQGGAGNVFALRKLGTTAGTAAAGNDTRFPAMITGIRKGNGTSRDTVATPADLKFASKNLAGLTVIDWDAADLFYEDMTANKTYTFANVRDGRRIVIILKKNGFTPTLPAVSTATVGAGTTFLQAILSNTPLGTTGLQIAI